MTIGVEHEPILELRNVSKSFGGLQVLRSINLTALVGERRAIIGPNGAGKTTLFNVICGHLKPTAGEILFRSRPIVGRSPDSIARLGLARTFQKNALFDNLSAAENICLALQQRRGLAHKAIRPTSAYGELDEGTAEVLETIGLADRKDHLVRELSYGEQRQLELAVALAMKPQALLLDEPTAGMSPAETTHMIEIIGLLPTDVTVVIIEHDMDVVFSVANRITVLDHGVVLAEGSPEEIQSNAAVREAYLGEAVSESNP
jgi:branched-chain amino acid transport system ATP-binding protein